MNENHLSKRLETVGSFVKKDSRLADIGSDHAYLPVALVLQAKINFAVAGEVVKGPFESAQKQIKKNNLENQIVVRLADGLDAIEPADRIDTITICGMGGMLIRDILENGWQNQRIDGSEQLILQPNIGESNVRRWLEEHGYRIAQETILEEGEKIYEVIVGEPTASSVAYTYEELLFGPILQKAKGPVFVKKWQRELSQKEHVLAQLAASKKDQSEKIKTIEHEINLIKEVLS